MSKIVNGAILLTLLGLAACSSLHRAPPTRQPAPVPNPTATTSASVPGNAIRIVPENARIEFVGSSERTSQTGYFQQVTGTFEARGDDLRGARLTLDIDMDSTTTNIALLTRHLKSKDFFDVAQYPHARFVSTSIQPSPTPEASHVITGELTLHGVTKQVVLNGSFEGRGSDLWGGQRVGYAAHITINRKDFGLTWNQALETGGVMVSDEVRIELNVEAVLQK